LLFLGLAAPLSTTILGWLAAAQIRRSAGGLHGLELAVFDGLLFPLLGLDVLILSLAHKSSCGNLADISSSCKAPPMHRDRFSQRPVKLCQG
jgi:hypothetical protein